MRSAWSDADADALAARAVQAGLEPDLGLRIYTTRLLGADPALVLHGGGNTSVKLRRRDLTGATIDVLCVKGSGWSMDTIEAEGLPAVRLDALRALRGLEALDDAAMVSAHRGALLDAASPTPSVETLMHAFLPHAFIDHTHASAVLAHADQPDGPERLSSLFGGRVAVLPWIMPGFRLAQAAAKAYEASPEIEGIVLDKHGIVTFGASAREAYERMIDLVDVAERATPGVEAPPCSAPARAAVAQAATALRAAVRDGLGRPFIVRHRASDAILAAVGEPAVRAAACRGVITPDHVIRTKPAPLVLERTDDGAVADAVRVYTEHYDAYVRRHGGGTGPANRPGSMDAAPRIALVPGIGLLGLGASARAAEAALDLAECGLEVVRQAEAIGRYTPLDETSLFEVEYWPLELAKLAGRSEPPLARRVVLVTGGAGAIGLATARHFAELGAAVALLDRDGPAAERGADALDGLGGGAIGLAADVTDAASVRDSFEAVLAAFGGIDVVVSNAGAAWSGRIGTVDEAVLRESFELNFFAHQRVAQAAVAAMQRQGGGCLLFNVSKQAVNPGPDFGPYGLPKAALLALVRQYALDHGRDGIRSNGINADRIRSGLLTEEMIRRRSEARGVSEAEYMGGNLLRREVTADDVARAFVALARSEATTGAILTVDGGNIAAALR